MKQEQKVADECQSGGWLEIPNSGDDAEYPRDYYSDSFRKGNQFEKSRAILGFLHQLGFDPQQVRSACQGTCEDQSKECRPVGLESDGADTLELEVMTMTFPDGSQRQMYWGHATDRGVIKVRATCGCVTMPI
jgi:hypothetical protein